MSSRRSRRTIAFTAVFVSFALFASACSGSNNDSSRSASAAAGNPVDLPALAAGTGTGERVPHWYGATVTPESWVSTSLSPVLAVPGGTGAWTFKVSDLSDGSSAFGTRTYSEQGASTRIPGGLLENGNMYVWTAESAGQQPVGGSFTVDVQMLDVQETDAFGGVNVLLSSGEAAFVWKSHSMQSLAGPVAVSLRFQGSSEPSSGVPVGWNLVASSSSPYLAVVSRSDGSAGLVSKNGQVSSYRKGAGESWNPVKLSGEGLDASGLAPVLIQNADGSWSVTTKGSTSRFIDDNSDGTADLEGLSANGSAVVNQEWTGGLLRKITDPVSGRSVELSYGGGSCPKVVSGFVAAPKDMLCQVKFWDGSTSAVSYVTLPDGSVSIGRLADYPEAGGSGAEVTDVAYDAAGRIARVRTPLVAAASASSVIAAADLNYSSEIAYTPEGRVSTVTDAAPAPGGKRCARTYQQEGTLSVVSDSCLGKRTEQVTFDGSTFFPLSVTDVFGRTATNQWNLVTGDLLSTTDFTGRVSTYEYKDGKMVTSRGPSRDLSHAQVTLRQYDESFAQSPEGIEMRGLDVVYWPSATDRGANSVVELGPQLNGSLSPSLTVNWASSPAGNASGGWSALMTGALTITNAGTYSFASGNTNAKLRIGNTACENNGCASLALPAGPVSIRVEVATGTQAASMDLTMSGPDTNGASASIPTSAVHPQFGYVTETKVVDSGAVRSSAEVKTRTTYENPSKGLVTATTSNAGAVSRVMYENGGWDRSSGSVLPAGNVERQEWWGDSESAKSPCPGATSVNQGGAAKRVVNPGPDGGDGPSVQQWFNAAGEVTATQVVGGGTECISYGKAGQITAVEIIGLGETAKTTFDDATGGNPLIATQTETKGTQVSKSVVEVDLAGRVIRTVDRFGIETLTTYDERTGAIATVTSTPPGSTAVVRSFTYDEFGRELTSALNGKVLSTISYDALGLPNSVTYGNGATSSLAYNASNALIDSTTTVAGRTYRTARTESAGGIASSDVLVANGKTSTFDYTHDNSGRLSAVSVSAGLVEQATTWTYGYDVNSNRVSQAVSVNGAQTGSYTYAYNGADQMTSSNDPAVLAGITYDDRGNATKVGSDSLTYDAMNLLVQATDGTNTVAYQRTVGGAIVGKTTTTAAGARSLKFGADGFVLDDQNRVLGQDLELVGGVLASRSTSGSISWTFTDLSGDRFFTLDDAGAQVGSVTAYNPFGQQVAGDPASIDDVNGWQAGGSSETLSLATSIVAMGQRVYVPALGRFAQVDPAPGGSANGYDYANQDPTSFSDPTGRAADDASWFWTGLISAVVAVATAAASWKASAAFVKANGKAFGVVLGMLTGLTIAGGISTIGFGVGLAVGLEGSQILTIVGAGVLAGISAGGIGAKVSAVRNAATAGVNQTDDFASGAARLLGAPSKGQGASRTLAPPTAAKNVKVIQKIKANPKPKPTPARLLVTPPSYNSSMYSKWANPKTGRLLS